MKKLLAFTMTIVLMFSLTITAIAAGPFQDNNIDDIPTGFELADYEDGLMTTASDGSGLAAAVAHTGQALAPNRIFVESNESGWSEEKEGGHMLFDGFLETKYGSHINDHPYRAVWRYADAFIAGNIILATANDSEGYPRRMDDGWTLEGSNDGSSWTVIYTGKGEDVEPYNYAWFVIPISGNTTAYTHYKLESEFGYDSDGIQFSEIELTMVPAPEPPPAVEEPAAPAPVVEAAPAPAPVAAPRPVAPQTGVTSLAILGVLGAAVTFGVVRRKK